MSKKLVENKYIIKVSIITIFILIGLVFSKDIIRFWYELGADPSCVSEKQKTESGYIPAQLVLTLKGNVTTSQAKEFIESRGLSFYEGYYNNRLVVPKGSELKWMCILQNETSFVDKVYTNRIIHVL